jgi:GxxExxY protein
MEDILYKELSDEIIGVCIEVHKLMGSHFGERIYEACVQRDLQKQGHIAERQKWVDIFFRGEMLDEQYRLDMLVDNKIIVEFKAVPDLDDSQVRQILCYLEATIYEVGYVVNFSRERLQFKRFILENDRKKYKPQIIAN